MNLHFIPNLSLRNRGGLLEKLGTEISDKYNKNDIILITGIGGDIGYNSLRRTISRYIPDHKKLGILNYEDIFESMRHNPQRAQEMRDSFHNGSDCIYLYSDKFVLVKKDTAILGIESFPDCCNLPLDKNQPCPYEGNYRNLAWPADYFQSYIYQGYDNKSLNFQDAANQVTQMARKAAQDIKAALETLYKIPEVKKIVIISGLPHSEDLLEFPHPNDSPDKKWVGLFINRFLYTEIKEIVLNHPKINVQVLSSSHSFNSSKNILPNLTETVFAPLAIDNKGKKKIAIHSVLV